MSFVRAAPKDSSTNFEKASISSGVSSFEKVVIGVDALPPGSFLTMHQDWPKSTSNYSSSLLKCFISSSLYTNCDVYLVHSDVQFCSKYLEGCPKQSAEEATRFPVVSEDKLKIAHRYKHLQLDESTPKTKYFLDLSSHLDTSSKKELLHLVSNLADVKPYSLIILLDAFAPNNPTTLSQVFDWKVAARKTKSLCIASVPDYCMDPQVISKLTFISDCVLKIQSLSSSPQGQLPEFREYDGFAQLLKPLSTPLRSIIPTALSVAFKCKGTRRFIFEPFHLPPDTSEAPSRQLSNCAKIDF